MGAAVWRSSVLTEEVHVGRVCAGQLVFVLGHDDGATVIGEERADVLDVLVHPLHAHDTPKSQNQHCVIPPCTQKMPELMGLEMGLVHRLDRKTTERTVWSCGHVGTAEGGAELGVTEHAQ